MVLVRLSSGFWQRQSDWPTYGHDSAGQRYSPLKVGVSEKFPDQPYRMSSPGTIYRNLIITGAAVKEGHAEGPAMDIRAWDLHTGKLA